MTMDFAALLRSWVAPPARREPVEEAWHYVQGLLLTYRSFLLETLRQPAVIRLKDILLLVVVHYILWEVLAFLWKNGRLQ